LIEVEDLLGYAIAYFDYYGGDDSRITKWLTPIILEDNHFAHSVMDSYIFHWAIRVEDNQTYGHLHKPNSFFNEFTAKYGYDLLVFLNNVTRKFNNQKFRPGWLFRTAVHHCTDDCVGLFLSNGIGLSTSSVESFVTSCTSCAAASGASQEQLDNDWNFGSVFAAMCQPRFSIRKMRMILTSYPEIFDQSRLDRITNYLIEFIPKDRGLSTHHERLLKLVIFMGDSSRQIAGPIPEKWGCIIEFIDDLDNHSDKHEMGKLAILKGFALHTNDKQIGYSLQSTTWDPPKSSVWMIHRSNALSDSSRIASLIQVLPSLAKVSKN